MKKLYTLVLAFISLFGYAQQNIQRCSSTEYMQMEYARDPQLIQKRKAMNDQVMKMINDQEIYPSARGGRMVYNIPVVVHVVHRTAQQNISNARIAEQIQVLNDDFRKLNTDAANVPQIWQPLAADVEINFCMAQRDPNNNATNGITRTSTTVNGFSLMSDNVKKTAQGGKDPWNTSKYLNIWVCDLSGSILGYAQFPGGDPSTDGVVIDFSNFGITGATAPYNKGRTLTHEVGHYLNLVHIWGDDTGCNGTDYISDTPNQATENYNCPTFPRTDNCSNASPGVMFMNFMDYTNDACMYFFTNGQKARMRSSLSSQRSSLLTSDGCVPLGGGGTASCDSIRNFLLTDTIVAYNNPNGWGTISGHNSFNDVAKADFFNQNIPAGAQINAVKMGFLKCKGTGQFNVRIWNANGTNGSPGTVLHTQSYVYNNVGAGLVQFPVNPPLSVSGPFYVGIEFAYAPGDTIALFTNTITSNAAGTGKAWEKWSNGNWFAFNDATNSWGINLDHYIEVKYCTQAAGSAPVANFIANPTTPIIGQNVTLVDQSTNFPTSWNWSITPSTFSYNTGSTATSQNPVVSFSQVGAYSVTLTATNANGSNSFTRTAYINVTGVTPVVANFSASPTTANIGQTVSLNDISTGQPDTWNWNITPNTFTYVLGTTATSQNPRVQFSASGLYDVTLTASKAGSSDVETKTGYVRVNDNTSVDENSGLRYMNVFPNPNSGLVNFHYILAKHCNLQVNVYDITGRVVFETGVNATKENQMQIDLSVLNSGIYFFEAVADNQRQVVKLVIKK